MQQSRYFIVVQPIGKDTVKVIDVISGNIQTTLNKLKKEEYILLDWFKEGGDITEEYVWNISTTILENRQKSEENLLDIDWEAVMTESLEAEAIDLEVELIKALQ